MNCLLSWHRDAEEEGGDEQGRGAEPRKRRTHMHLVSEIPTDIVVSDKF